MQAHSSKFIHVKTGGIRWPRVLSVSAIGMVAAYGFLSTRQAPAVPSPVDAPAVQVTAAARSTESFEQAWQQANQPSASANGTAQAPVRTSAQPVNAAQTAEDRAQAEVYARFDAQLQPSASFPPWVTQRNLHAEVASADSNATLSGIACAPAFCRFSVASSGAVSREELVDKLGSALVAAGTPVMYRYPENDPNQTLVYLMNPSPEQMRALQRTQ